MVCYDHFNLLLMTNDELDREEKINHYPIGIGTKLQQHTDSSSSLRTQMPRSRIQNSYLQRHALFPPPTNSWYENENSCRPQIPPLPPSAAAMTSSSWESLVSSIAGTAPPADGVAGTEGVPGRAGIPALGIPGAGIGKALSPGRDVLTGRPGADGTEGTPGSDGTPGTGGVNGAAGSEGTPGVVEMRERI